MEHERAARLELHRDRVNRKQVFQLTDTSSLILLAVFAVLLTVVFYAPTDNWRWDPSFYYAQLRAPLIEHQLDFRAETIPHNGVRDYTVNGLQPSPWPIGPGLLWAPFFMAAQLYTRLAHGIARPTGFEPVSIAAVSAGSAFYGMLGLLLVYPICRCFTSSSRAVLSAGLVLLGTPLLYYTYRQPIMAHSTSFLASASLMLICLLVYHQRLDLRVSGLAIGVCIGLNFLMRWTGLLLALVPLTFWIVFSIDAFRRGERAALRLAGVQFVIAGMASAITVLPQLALWHQLHGRWLVFPPQDFSSARLAANISNVFFSTNRGLVFWSPVMLLGMIGLVLLRSRTIQMASLLYLLAQLGILGVRHDWYGGGGFGPRFLIESLPVLAIGLAVLLDRLAPRHGVWLGGALLAVLGFHQLVLVTMVEQHWLPMQNYYQGQPIGFDVQLMGLIRVLREPGALLLPRPSVGGERQALLLSLVQGRRGLSFYGMPLVALAVSGLGLFAPLLARTLFAPLLARTRWIAVGAALLACYMLGWCCFLLAL